MVDDRVYVVCVWSDEYYCWSPLLIRKSPEGLGFLARRLSFLTHVWTRVMSVAVDDDEVIASALSLLKPPLVEARFGVMRRGIWS